MIDLGLVVTILEMHRQGLSVAAIARTSGVDRKTVRKYLERGLEEPTYGPRHPRPREIDRYLTYLRDRVAAYPALTGSRLHRELRELGYQGGYTTVTDALRDLRPPKETSYEVRFETLPGEQAQVDFAHFEVVFDDEPSERRVVWLFSMVLGHSRFTWARFVLHQDLATVLRCHVMALEHFGGAPKEILYDRMKTAVIGERRHEGIIYNNALIDLARHFGFHPRACQPYRAKTKGKVERTFRYVREDFFLARSFQNLEDLNRQLALWLEQTANKRVHGTTRRVVSDAFAEERPHLRALPLAPFKAVLRTDRRISKDGLVSVDGNFYSVPDGRRARRPVDVETLATEIRIYEDGVLIASHPVQEGRGNRRVAPGHRKPLPPRRQSGSEGTVILGQAGDVVARRSLAVYEEIGRRLSQGATR